MTGRSLIRTATLHFLLPTGAELLTNYEQDTAGFWDAVRGNLAQHSYCHTLEQKGRVRLMLDVLPLGTFLRPMKNIIYLAHFHCIVMWPLTSMLKQCHSQHGPLSNPNCIGPGNYIHEANHFSK